MNGILIDENLPSRISIPTKYAIEHVSSLGASPSDTMIWEYARKNGLAILTKDADFSIRIAATDPPPWIVHVRVGNMRLREMVTFLEKYWPAIEAHLPTAKLIAVFSNRIEVTE